MGVQEVQSDARKCQTFRKGEQMIILRKRCSQPITSILIFHIIRSALMAFNWLFVIQFREGNVPQAYRDMIERAWLETPGLRPTFKELNEQIQRMTRGK